MKKITLLFIQIFLITAFAHAQEIKSIRYFNIKNKEISEQKFKEIRSTNKVLDIVGDSTNHRKLIAREETGNSNRNELVAALEKAGSTKIDSNTTIIIVYYPGEDLCNSTGQPGRFVLTNKETEKNAKQLAKTKTFYIFKDSKGLERYDGLKWIKDPENLIERLFFKYHYPCNSFAVISKTGKYKSYFGEYMPDYLLNAIKILNQ